MAMRVHSPSTCCIRVSRASRFISPLLSQDAVPMRNPLGEVGGLDCFPLRFQEADNQEGSVWRDVPIGSLAVDRSDCVRQLFGVCHFRKVELKSGALSRGHTRSRIGRAAMASPAFAFSIRALTMASTSPSPSVSRAIIVLFREPCGRPFGFPDWPGWNRCGLFCSVPIALCFSI